MKGRKKGNFILDLDQTLISAEACEDYDFKKNKKKAEKFEFHNMENYYIIFERPYLQDFLTYLFDNFNVSVWTAATKDYALFIINNVILQSKYPNRKLDYVFFSYHCKISKKIKNNDKDLSLLWDTFKLTEFNKNNTIILDDMNYIYENQKSNCIRAKSFEFTEDGSEKDIFLKELKKELEKEVENKEKYGKAVLKINNTFKTKYKLKI